MFAGFLDAANHGYSKVMICIVDSYCMRWCWLWQLQRSAMSYSSYKCLVDVIRYHPFVEGNNMGNLEDK